MPVSPNLNGDKIKAKIAENGGRESDMQKYVSYKDGYNRVFANVSANLTKEEDKRGKKRYNGKYNYQ